MSSVALYSHERGQLVNVRSRHWIVNGVCLNTLPPSILSPIFNPPDKLDAFFGSMRSGAAFTADVKDIRSYFRFGIETKESSVICSLFEADGERDAASREDLDDW